MREKLGRDLERQLDLYLDGRLTGSRRVEFERRMRTDRALREAVEFHRGLTLEFHEEAPPLPAGYAERARVRLERVIAAGGSPAADEGRAGRPDPRTAWGRAAAPSGAALPWWRRLFVLPAVGAAAAVALVVALLLPRFLRRETPATPPVAAPPPAAGSEERRRADQETLEALRSLGYIAREGTRSPARRSAERGAKPAARPTAQVARAPLVPPASSRTGASPRTAAAAATPAPPRAEAPAPTAASSPAPAAASTSPPETGLASAPATVPEAVPVASPAPSPVASPADVSPETAVAPSPAPAPPARESAAAAVEEPEGERLPFRRLEAARAPRGGLDHETIRTPEEWAAAARGGEAAGVDFAREMVLLIRDDMEGEPPRRLRVVSVTRETEGVRVECRAEPRDPTAPASPGQAIVLPATDRPVRLVVR